MCRTTVPRLAWFHRSQTWCPLLAMKYSQVWISAPQKKTLTVWPMLIGSFDLMPRHFARNPASHPNFMDPREVLFNLRAMSPPISKWIMITTRSLSMKKCLCLISHRLSAMSADLLDFLLDFPTFNLPRRCQWQLSTEFCREISKISFHPSNVLLNAFWFCINKKVLDRQGIIRSIDPFFYIDEMV